MKLFNNVSHPTPGWGVPFYWNVSRRQYAATTIREIRSQLKGHRSGGYRHEGKGRKAERVAAAEAEAAAIIAAWIAWVKAA